MLSRRRQACKDDETDPAGSVRWRQVTTGPRAGQGSSGELCRFLYSFRVDTLSVTEAGRRGVARLVADAAHGDEVVVERHGAPVAAVVGIERLRELEALRDDVRDLALAVARVADDDQRRVTLGEAMEAFGR
ncbi:MAG: type II toxin-antitoxin system Phd/YefM family antitoxin [Acidimicrobiia bacterium]